MSRYDSFPSPQGRPWWTLVGHLIPLAQCLAQVRHEKYISPIRGKPWVLFKVKGWGERGALSCFGCVVHHWNSYCCFATMSETIWGEANFMFLQNWGNPRKKENQNIHQSLTLFGLSHYLPAKTISLIQAQLSRVVESPFMVLSI